jgi:type II secretory pathway pseudopilin PulG
VDFHAKSPKYLVLVEIHLMVMFKVGLTPGWSMNIELLGILLTIIGVIATVALNSWMTIKATQAATMRIGADLATLNESLGEMYSQIIEGGVGIEPPNPVQAIFAQILQSQMQQKENPKVISRNDDGTFSDNS